jgi:hypothetical protein
MNQTIIGSIVEHNTSKNFASLAQLVELHPYTVAVGGSSPSGRTKYATVAEWPNATDCKSVKPGVQIPPVAPKYILAILPKCNDKI